MSRVYTIRNMKTQAADMAELVLFYAHATLSTQTLPPPPGSVTSAYRVMVPFFPSSIFKPHEGIVRIGKVVRLLNLSTLRRPSGQSFPQFLPLRIYGYSERTGHDGEIVVTFILQLQSFDSLSPADRFVFLLSSCELVSSLNTGRPSLPASPVSTRRTFNTTI